HTVSHAALSQLAYGDQYAEIANNKAYLESETGQTVQFLAWPYGDSNASAVQAAADSGIIAAFDAWGGPANLTALDPWHIPRVLVDGGYAPDTITGGGEGAGRASHPCPTPTSTPRRPGA